MKKTISIFLVLITMVSLITTTVLAAPTAMLTPTVELGQLKVCKVAGSGVEQGTLFSFRVNGNLYSIPAGPADRNGYCILAGQYPVNTQVTIEEVIPSGYYVSRIEVRPDRTISKDTGQGKATVNIVSGVIEAIFTNRAIGSPTQMPTSTTPRPTKTATSTPSCDPNCTPTATPIPMGRLQICKEAEGPGVSGLFTFNFDSRSRSVPVGACAGLISVRAGTLTITETAQSGYTVADIYTIPANRLISKDLSSGMVTVRIVEGAAASQTIVVFRNRAVSLTSTPTSTATGSQTVTSTPTPTGSITPTATGTPTGSVTPTFTPTSTGSVTATPVCPPVTVFANFSNLELGDTVEGMGTVAPYLNINFVQGMLQRIEAGNNPNNPFGYRAGDPPIVNGGISDRGGFTSADVRTATLPEYIYEFTFAQGITVSDFSVRMLDFGDFNPRRDTHHSVVMTAFNEAGNPIATQDLTYTTDAEVIPENSPEWGSMRIHGDALFANDGDPGKWTWQVNADGIAKIILRFSGEGFDPNFGFDSLSYTTEVCPVCQPFSSTNFSQVPAGTAIEGYGVLAPYFSINAKGTAVKIRQGQDPFQYRAGIPPIVNGGIGADGGIGDTDTRTARLAHRYTFTFALGISVSEFSVRMLDYGDLNPTLDTDHLVSITAYNANDAVVDTQELRYTTEPESLPDNSPEWGNLQDTGDALRSVSGQPGNWTWVVNGDGIVQVILDFGVGYDPNIGLDSLSYTCSAP